MPVMELVQTRKALRVLIVDDVFSERAMIVDCLEQFASIEVHECSSVEEVERLGSEDVFDVCLLDIRFGEDEANRIVDLLDIAEDRWPHVIKIVVTGYTSKEVADCAERIHDIVFKSELEAKPSVLIAALDKAVKRVDYCDRPNRSQVIEEFRPFLERQRTKVLFETIGWVVEAQDPYMEVQVVEYQKDGHAESRGLLMPYDLFVAAGVLGRDERFRYRIFQRDNQVTSEILRLDEEDGQPVELDPKVETILREVEDMQDQARRRREEAHG